MDDKAGTLDAFDLEFQVQEKLVELSWKTEVLQETQKELALTRQQLNEQKMLLEDELRSHKATQVQLQSTSEVTKMLEKENMKNHRERLQVQINYETMVREHESLREQTRTAKIENMRLNSEILDLKNELENKSKHGNIEQSFSKLRIEIVESRTNLQNYLSKLAKEHEYLQKSVETMTKINKRLQSIGMCLHSIHKNRETVVKNLERKLAVVSSSVTPARESSEPAILENHKVELNAQVIMSELKSESEKMEDFEKQFNNFLDDLQTLSNE